MKVKTVWGSLFFLGWCALTTELFASFHLIYSCFKIYLLDMSTLQLSSDTPEEGTKSHYIWL